MNIVKNVIYDILLSYYVCYDIVKSIMQGVVL